MSNDGADSPEPTPEYLDDSTLGGYFETHDRPPAFEGSDGLPYTVSIEIERTGDLRLPYCGYLVFPRWAETGVGIIGHVETETLSEGRSEGDVRTTLDALTLYDVQDLLERAIAARESDVDD
ncbi:MAG: hypothetical protein U5R14_13975 [Gemmatimonadota bacterium]|nr:hypothetical protein [Gemmatimonadota bacterium]